MNDPTHRLSAIENKLADFESRLENLARFVRRLSDGADRRRNSTQAAIDNLRSSINLLHESIDVPQARFDPNHRDVIE